MQLDDNNTYLLLHAILTLSTGNDLYPTHVTVKILFYAQEG